MSDPLSGVLSDPLASLSTQTESENPSKQRASSSTSSWARHDFEYEPFSRPLDWSDSSAAARGGAEEQHGDASLEEGEMRTAVEEEEDEEEHFAYPAPPLAAPPARPSPSPTAPSHPKGSAPITMRSASSIFRERSSSNSAIKDGHTPFDESSALPSPPLHTHYGVSVTPTGAHTPFAHFRSSSEQEMSATPSVSAIRAHRHSSIATELRQLDFAALAKIVFTAAAAGDLERIRQVLTAGEEEDGAYPSPFALANATNKEGETPLHVAAYRGHLHVTQYLENSGATVEVGDNDGWTPLHNACSRGFLDIARFLVEDAGAVIDRQSTHGYSALMNAASRGHLPIVLFLTTKHRADPLLRNQFQETAYDLAASVFEVAICSALASYESGLWSSVAPEGIPRPPYNSLTLHSTVPIALHENQRLARPTLKKLSSLGTLAAGQAPRWSSKALSKNDKRTAFTMPAFPGVQTAKSETDRPVFKSEIGLPIIGQESVLGIPPAREVRSGGRPRLDSTTPEQERPSSVAEGKRRASNSSASNSLSAVLAATSSSDGGNGRNVEASNSNVAASKTGEPAWFWLSDWSVDLTDRSSSPLDGWSYASSFDAPLQEWSPEPPEDLQRVLDGAGGMGLGGKKYVRRRRWVRVMRRRLDLPNWGFGGDGSEEEETVPTARGDEAQSTDDFDVAPANSDYLVRAQFLAGSHANAANSDRTSIRSGKSGKTVTHEADGSLDRVELRKAALRLERACDELRLGTVTDEDSERRRLAEDQLEAFLHQLALIRAELGPDEDEEDSDDEFIYSGRDADPDDDNRSVWTNAVANNARPASISSRQPAMGSSDYFSQPLAPPSTSQGIHYDLTPQLSQAPDFRVPTHETRSRSETISKPSIIRSVPVWEADEAASSCCRCSRKFTFFQRKHHCRRCGRVVCASCSTHNDRLDPSDVVKVPGALEEDPWTQILPFKYRVCDPCHAALSSPPGMSPSSILSAGAFLPTTSILGTSSPIAGSDAGASDVSELSECPVCGTLLAGIGDRTEQEEHVKDCLETGGGKIASNGRYLVFKLPPGPLAGDECKICFEDLQVGESIARLACLCYFHQTCIRAWFDRKGTCPFHSSRDD